MFKQEELSYIIQRINESTSKEDMPLRKKLWEAISTMSSIAKTWQERQENRVENRALTHCCQQCGKCCKKANDLLEGTATINDVAIWIAAKRSDILKWVNPIMTPNSELLGFDIWIGPRTDDDAKRCPWLRKRKGEKLHECKIYDVRPQVCRDFPLNLTHAMEVGCPAACQEKLQSDTGQVIEEDSTPRRDDD